LPRERVKDDLAVVVAGSPVLCLNSSTRDLQGGFAGFGLWLVYSESTCKELEVFLSKPYVFDVFLVAAPVWFVVSVSHAEAQPGRQLFCGRKHKYISNSIGLRDDLLEEIDRFADEELPFSSRSAAVAVLIAKGLQRWRKQQERKHARGRQWGGGIGNGEKTRV